MLSPAKFVWMMRSFDCCAANGENDTAPRAMPAKTARPRNICLLFIFVILLSTKGFREISYRLLFRLLSHDKRFEGLPRRILLRGELLSAAVMGISAGLFRERMFNERAVHTAGYRHALDQCEVLARLFFVPARAAGRERHQMQRCVVARVAHNASRMARTLGQEDGLYLGLEKLVVQRRRCGGGSSRRTLRLAQQPGRGQKQTRGGDHIRRGPLHWYLQQ